MFNMEGWINFDASPVLRLQRLPVIGRLFKRGKIIFPKEVRFGNIVKGLPVVDGSVRGVYASHVLEHLPLTEFWIALQQTFCMLRSGGIFRLVIPDLEIRARKYLEQVSAGDTNANSWFMQATYLGLPYRKRGVEALARTAFGNSSHLWMWDEISMAAALKKVGFISVRRCRFHDSTDEAFLSVEDFGRFHDGSVDLEECAMEAIKP
jgi:hypothetical protein